MRRLLLLLLIVAAEALGQGAAPDPDTRIRFEQVACDGRPACFQGCSVLRLEGTTSRVVGRGLLEQGDVDSRGQLANAESYIDAGIIEPTAKLRLEWGGQTGLYSGWGGALQCSPYSITSTVTVNDKYVGTLAVSYCDKRTSIQRTTLNVPVSALRFGTRNVGGTPTPGKNVIKIYTADSSRLPIECGDHDGNELGSARIDFETMAPIAMVHGIRSGPQWFRDLGFIEPFDNTRMPYKLIGPLGEGSIEAGGIRLRDELRRMAEEFGTQHLHIVAHSKGGLWSRSFLNDGEPGAFGIYSLTTLDTPHHGSVGADLRMAARRATFIDLIEHPEFRLPLLAPFTDSIPDLVVGAVEAFNSRSHLPETMSVLGRTNKVRYLAYSGDANLDGSMDRNGYGTIECPSECQPDWDFSGRLYSIMQTYRSVIMKRNSSGNWLFDTVKWGRPYPLNDFIVTVRSAQYPLFTPALGSGADGQPIPWKKNHSTIGDREVGSAIYRTDWLKMQKELQQ